MTLSPVLHRIVLHLNSRAGACSVWVIPGCEGSVCSLSFPCHTDTHTGSFLWTWGAQPAWGFGLRSGGGSPVVAGKAASCPESSEANVSRAQALQAWGRLGMRQIWQEADLAGGISPSSPLKQNWCCVLLAHPDLPALPSTYRMHHSGSWNQCCTSVCASLTKPVILLYLISSLSTLNSALPCESLMCFPAPLVGL